MFDSLALENPKRKWATMMSFTLETALVGMLIAAPLGFTEKLQLLHVNQLVAPIGMPVGATAPPQENRQAANNTNTSELNADDTIIEPSRIPPTITRVVDENPVGPPRIGDYIVGAAPLGASNPFMKDLMSGIRPHVAAAPPSVPHAPVKISVLDPGFLLHRVQPIYPHNAIITHTEGTVMLTALIDTSGRITQLHAISGHPFLIQAAVDAVKQWRYKPYILNGSPVEVETQVSVNFTLSR